MQLLDIKAHLSVSVLAFLRPSSEPVYAVLTLNDGRGVGHGYQILKPCEFLKIADWQILLLGRLQQQTVSLMQSVLHRTSVCSTHWF